MGAFQTIIHQSLQTTSTDNVTLILKFDYPSQRERGGPMKGHNILAKRLRLQTGFAIYIFMQFSYADLLPDTKFINQLIKLKSKIDLSL